MATFTDFFRKFMRFGLERFGKYYGVYRGFVVSVSDPQERGRVQVRVKTVSNTAFNVWVDPHFAGAGTDRGTFWPPEVGDSVAVTFQSGDSRRPEFYHGGWHGSDDMPAEFAYSDGRPERRGFITRAGHGLIFVDEPDSERVRLLWHKPDPSDEALTDPTLTADRTQGQNAFLSMEADGSIQIVNANGTLINLDAKNGNLVIIDENGNSVTFDGDGVKLIAQDGSACTVGGGGMTVIGGSAVTLNAPTVNIKAGGVFLGDIARESVPLGDSLLRWLNSHTHGTGVGPSTPPQPPATPELLSQKVKVA